MKSGKNNNAVPILTEFRNFYFPIDDSTGTGLVPVMHRQANRLDQYFAPVQPNRPRVDHSIWKQAIAEAERRILPYRASMQEIFIGTVLNGHVTACIQKRKDMILLKEYELVNDKGEVDEEATKLIKKSWFINVLNYIQEAQFFGYSLITFGNLDKDFNFNDLQLIRRDCISPDRKIVSFVPRVPSGIAFDDPRVKDSNGEAFYDWNLYVATPSDIGISPCGYGLLYKVALYEIILRNIIGWNSDYIETFGQPLKWAKTNAKFGEEEYAALEKGLSGIGSNGYLMTDFNTELDFITGGGGTGGGWQSYDNMEQRCLKTISKILLGHADALDSTAGKLGAGQGEHSDTARALSDVEKTDARFVTTAVNDLFIPKLINLGFKLNGLKFQFKNDSEKHERMERDNRMNQEAVNWLKTLKDTGYKLKTKFVAERMNIPVEEFEKTDELEKKEDELEKKEDETGFSKSISAKLNEVYNKHDCKNHG